MKILHLSTFDFGGAGTAAYRLHYNLRKYGCDSKMVVFEKGSDDADVIPYSTGISFKLRTILAKSVFKLRTDADYYFQDQRRTVTVNPRKLCDDVGFKPDVIIAHWISNFVSAQTLANIHRYTEAPVYWYLMDMAPLTGGCHYAWNCEGYVTGCGECPALRSRKRNDLSHKVLLGKLRALESMDCTIVAASSRLHDQAGQAALTKGKMLNKILLGVDPATFSPPKDRCDSRRELGLPENATVIFFGALSKQLKRKGTKFLLEALDIIAADTTIQNHRIVLATAGSFADIGLEGTAFQHHHLGVLRGDRALATAYQAANFFVCPSVEDSGPMMINESVMCGTPVVSFDMGVSRDLVIPGLTGYRARLSDSRDLAAGIKSMILLTPEESEKMSSDCRVLASRLCHPEVQASSFWSLFEHHSISS